MKLQCAFLAAAVLVLQTIHSPATVLYVDLNSTNPVPPYADWSTAATDIQSAIDASSDGDQIWVNDGVYATGGRVVYGSLTNRVVINKAITVQSVNGPAVTAIQGYQDPNTVVGDDAVRCVYLTNNASLIGFTLTNGATRSTGDINGNIDWEQGGGGIYCESQSASISNCVIMGNSAQDEGGGVYSGTLSDCLLANSTSTAGGAGSACVFVNCILTNNQSGWGGGAYQASLTNCLIANNTAVAGGGAHSCVLNNCTVVDNFATVAFAGDYYAGIYGGTANNCVIYYNNGANQFASTIDHCCSIPLAAGTGNFTNEPLFVSLAVADFHLQSNSPCLNVGNNAAVYAATDLDGNTRIVENVVDIGCYEYQSPVPLTVEIQAQYTNVAPGFIVGFLGTVAGGHPGILTLDFGDGTILTNQIVVSHAWATPGTYTVTLMASNDYTPGGAIASVTVNVLGQLVRYVAENGTNPISPYLSWDTAATNIQDAIDVSVTAGLVLVSNGVYQTGGELVYGSLTNRVVVNKPIVVQSVNGPMVTIIQGSQTPGTTNGDSAIRCVYLTNNAWLIGFTLTNGATRGAGDSVEEQSGGGIWCESTNTSIVSNCVITANASWNMGGGAYQGALANCTLANNSSGAGGGASSALLVNCTLANNSAGTFGGGVSSALLVNCTLETNSAASGGGAYLGALNNCIVLGNVASSSGGGTFNSTVVNSAIAGNSASSEAGGAYGGNLVNCTITGNFASSDGGGTAYANQINCVNYYNRSRGSPTNYFSGSFSYCCTTPLPGGAGNISSDPLLASASHLSLNSPCRGVGNAAVTSGVDIDGEPWANPPSMGCDELYPGNVTGNIGVSISVFDTNTAPGSAANFQANISGAVYAGKWDFGDGTVVSNRLYLSHVWSAVGDYPVVLTAYNDTYPDGQSATNIMHVYLPAVLYVANNNMTPVAPYDSWAKAATNIQDAIDASSAGALILVTNGYPSSREHLSGIYQTGGRVVYGSLSNRVAITKPVTVQSVSGPAVTWISGNSTIRCVYLTNGAALIGFTLTNGSTLRNTGDSIKEQSGGGVWCESANAIISNCVIAANFASGFGGGVYSGTLSNCTIINNSATYGGGAGYSTMYNCTISNNSASIGAGVFGSILNNCKVLKNAAVSTSYGGGAFGGTLNNCMLANNSAYNGGGVCGGTPPARLTIPAFLYHCTISNNTATYGSGAGNTDPSSPLHSTNCILNNCVLVGNSGGDASYYCQLTGCMLVSNSVIASGVNYTNCAIVNNSQVQAGNIESLNNCTIANNGTFMVNGATLNNCIVYSNKTFSMFGVVAQYCCIPPPLVSGPGNFTNAPLFVNQAGGDFHLQSNSPCINAGNNSYITSSTDFDGSPRIVGGTVDVGAYEYQTPSSVLSYAWAQQYGFPTDGSADYADPDGDGMNNWQEWKAGTTPTNAQSVLKMASAAPTNSPVGCVVTWQSVSGITYFLQSSTNLALQPAFSTIQSNIVGQAVTTSYTDTSATNGSQYFYRVGVQ